MPISTERENIRLADGLSSIENDRLVRSSRIAEKKAEIMRQKEKAVEAADLQQDGVFVEKEPPSSVSNRPMRLWRLWMMRQVRLATIPSSW